MTNPKFLGCHQFSATYGCPDRSTTISCWMDRGLGPCEKFSELAPAFKNVVEGLTKNMDRLFK